MPFQHKVVQVIRIAESGFSDDTVHNLNDIGGLVSVCGKTFFQDSIQEGFVMLTMIVEVFCCWRTSLLEKFQLLDKVFTSRTFLNALNLIRVEFDCLLGGWRGSVRNLVEHALDSV